VRNTIAAKPIKGRITLSGYEGSELLVARLLIESGAEVRYVGTRGVHLPMQIRLNRGTVVTPDHSLPLFMQAPPDLQRSGFAGLSELLRFGLKFRRVKGRQLADLIAFATGSLGEFLDPSLESAHLKSLVLSNSLYGKHGGPYDPGTLFGLLFTPWELTGEALVAALVALAAGSVLYLTLRFRGRLSAPLLLLQGVFYLGYVGYVLTRI